MCEGLDWTAVRMQTLWLRCVTRQSSTSERREDKSVLCKGGGALDFGVGEVLVGHELVKLRKEKGYEI